ncbi:bifunctional 4-hydroxy-2-oxoglutarate aldolase/2-dehydro-3-deoxy-phosphogluconate aldolase [Parafrigoribacterium mesophilum]|uniref:bifunctional 4-hydroxy-2-oxoglutarate aldolase/2-dehydro-3-deoxy-phosphogluconate aldolase n=1 Tax=Parafrigoribacterium mesophilum TaxID=433646 RepID=UPI0031FCE7C0
MTDSTRSEPSQALLQTPLIAVLRAARAEDYDQVVAVLGQNGVRCVELTLSTPGTIEHLPDLIEHTGTEVEIGVGTITTVAQAQRAIDAGAKYLVTPVTDLDIIALALKHRLPVFPGGLTPTELHSAWRAGATAVKIFPAQTVGAKYGSHLRGPFPYLKFVPSGGVALDDIPAWLHAGATAVSLGGPLIGDALKGGSLQGLAERTKRAVEIVREATR